MNNQPSTSPFAARSDLSSARLIVSLLLVFLLCLAFQSSYAGSATWNSAPGSAFWNTADNWTPATVPNGSSDTATFGVSTQTRLSLSAATEVGEIVFDS